MTGETADADAERAENLVFMSGRMGVDLARYGLDEPIGKVDSNAILSALKVFQSVDPDGREWAIVRSVVRVADTLQQWVEEIDVDGFTQP
jgi:long-chain alkane monooxygenase